MLRGLGLTLLCLTAIAVPAAAGNSIEPAAGKATVAHQGAITQAMEPARRRQAEPAQVSALSPAASSALRAGSAAGPRRQSVNRLTRSASQLPQPRERQELVALPWLKQSNSGVAVALTDRFRLGFRYRYVEGEDLWPEFADTGAADYGSHHLLLRASWRF